MQEKIAEIKTKIADVRKQIRTSATLEEAQALVATYKELSAELFTLLKKQYDLEIAAHRRDMFARMRQNAAQFSAELAASMRK